MGSTLLKSTLYTVCPVSTCSACIPSHPSCVCSVITILPLTEDGLEIELVSGIYFPEIHIMSYSICPPTTSCDCTSSLPIWGKFRLAPSLCTRSLKINSLMHMVCETNTDLLSQWHACHAAAQTVIPHASQTGCSLFPLRRATGTQATKPRHSAELLLLPLVIMFISPFIWAYLLICIIIWGGVAARTDHNKRLLVSCFWQIIAII